MSNLTKMTKKELINIINNQPKVSNIEAQAYNEGFANGLAKPKSCGVWKFFKVLIVIVLVYVAVLFTAGFIYGAMNAVDSTDTPVEVDTEVIVAEDE